MLLPEALRQADARFGGRLALVQGERRLTYAALWAQVQAAAAWWRGSGLAPGERVALVLPNCIESVVAYYSAWLAGAVVVPLNAQAKSRDLGHWLAHSGARFLVHEAGNAELERSLADLQPAPARIAVGGSVSHGAVPWPEVIAPRAPVAAAALQPDKLAMLLYTSGTTGRPKGVMLSHGNLEANVESVVQYLALGPGDSIVSLLPFYYSYGNSVLHTHLSVGGAVVLEQNLVFPHAVVETLARERATGFSGVPSTFALLLSRVALEKYDLRSLRYITQAGGAMAPALARRLQDTVPGARLFVMYGQTEATARLTFLPPERLHEKLGSAGIPIPGVRIQVRDEQGREAPAGEPGEVWARGGNVMLGYWCDEESTREVLVDGWLKTGDLGHLDADGYLYLVGRRSDMIKTGAHRVNPKDIEEAIAELPAVAEVAVAGIDDELLGQVIKAFVVPAPGAAFDVNAVKAHCRERLPAFKIPKHIEIVASLPKTASGKIRRVELANKH